MRDDPSGVPAVQYGVVVWNTLQSDTGLEATHGAEGEAKNTIVRQVSAAR